MPIRKAQTLLATLALMLAVFAPIWHSAPHHRLSGWASTSSPPVKGVRLAAAQSEDAIGGGICPACLHQRLLSQSRVESVVSISPPACSTGAQLESDTHPVSHRSLPPGARAPPAC